MMMKKYEVMGIIGEGTYGVVYKARNKESGAIVAVKKTKCEDPSGNEDSKTMEQRTLKELKILRSINHPNVVQLHEAFRKQGQLFFVFEYVERNLLEVLEESPNGLSQDLIRLFSFQLLSALHACSSKGVVHRDLKPENLLITRQNELKLCDFGLARKTDLTESGGNKMTGYVATRWYRAPELLLGTSIYGCEIDIWAVGCIMAEMADGDPIFSGDTEIEQIYLITTLLGDLPDNLKNLFLANPRFLSAKINEGKGKALSLLSKKYAHKLGVEGVDLLWRLLELDPAKRLTPSKALMHPFFQKLRKPQHPTSVSLSQTRRSNFSKSNSQIHLSSKNVVTHLFTEENPRNELAQDLGGNQSKMRYSELATPCSNSIKFSLSKINLESSSSIKKDAPPNLHTPYKNLTNPLISSLQPRIPHVPPPQRNRVLNYRNPVIIQPGSRDLQNSLLQKSEFTPSSLSHRHAFYGTGLSISSKEPSTTDFTKSQPDSRHYSQRVSQAFSMRTEQAQNKYPMAPSGMMYQNSTIIINNGGAVYVTSSEQKNSVPSLKYKGRHHSPHSLETSQRRVIEGGSQMKHRQLKHSMEDLNLKELREEKNEGEVLVLGDDYVSCTQTEDISEHEESPSHIVSGNVYDIDDDEMQFNPHFSLQNYANPGEQRHHTNEDIQANSGMLTPEHEHAWTPQLQNPYVKLSNPPSFGGNGSLFEGNHQFRKNLSKRQQQVLNHHQQRQITVTLQRKSLLKNKKSMSNNSSHQIVQTFDNGLRSIASHTVLQEGEDPLCKTPGLGLKSFRKYDQGPVSGSKSNLSEEPTALRSSSSYLNPLQKQIRLLQGGLRLSKPKRPHKNLALSASESKKSIYGKQKVSFQKSPTPYRNIKSLRPGRSHQRNSYQRSTTTELDNSKQVSSANPPYPRQSMRPSQQHYTGLPSSGVQSPMLYRISTGRASSMIRNAERGQDNQELSASGSPSLGYYKFPPKELRMKCELYGSMDLKGAAELLQPQTVKESKNYESYYMTPKFEGKGRQRSLQRTGEEL